jgi:uncharacterized protein (TIRG00374 family)
VARTVPWRDTLVWRGGEASVHGRIEGEWSSDAIGFVVDPEAAARTDLPAGLRARLDASIAGPEGTRIEVRRDEDTSWMPGMPRVFRGLEAGALAIAVVLLIGGILFTSTRWWRLLHAAECPTTWLTAMRLNVLGFFFNIVIPGLTGGDVVKAVMAAKEHPERKAAAVISILVDRLLGLFVLALMAAFVVLKLWDQMAEIRWPVILGVAAGALGTLVYCSRALRRLVHFDAVVARLPGGAKLKKLDEAVLIYSKHPADVAWAVACSAGNHVCVFSAIYLLARSFGADDLSPFEGFAVVSIGNIVSSLPIAPGGWGVGEAAYGYLFDMLGSSRTLGLATSITFRLALMAVGLFGGLLLLLPGGREALDEVQAAGAAEPES